MDIGQRYYNSCRLIIADESDTLAEKVQRLVELKDSLKAETEDVKIHQLLKDSHNAIVKLLISVVSIAAGNPQPLILFSIAEVYK